MCITITVEQHHKDVGGNTEDLTAAIMSFASEETTGCGFSFGGAGKGAAEEIPGAMLCVSCPDHKQSKHMFFTGPPACCSLHSCRAQRSKSTNSNHCLTSRRTHHCWASCLEMLMLFCGFFRTLGQHLPHQMYLSFAALIPAWALFSVQSIFHEWQAWGSPKVVKGKQDAKWNT